MAWSIEYHHADVVKFVRRLPKGLAARFLRLTDLMQEFGADLGMPHTRPLKGGLFEPRLKSREGIARVFYCTLVERRIVMLHGFIKKSQRTPTRHLRVARARLLEAQSNDPR